MAKVTAKLMKNKEVVREITVEVNIGEDLDSAIELLGEEIVFTNYARQATIGAQSVARGMLHAGKKDAEIEKYMSSWKPGTVRRVKADPIAKIKKQLAGMKTKQERETFLDGIRKIAAS